MKFFIEKHTTTPIAQQIEEQIKLAVMMGIFRNGDTLPSIRDIEKQTDISRNQIHKAYLNLRRSGLLILTRGKGSVITTATDYPRSINENCQKLSQSIISKVRRLHLSPIAFARYLSRNAQENERNEPCILYVDIHKEVAAQTADEISKWWQVPVNGVAFWELENLPGARTGGQRVLVNHVMYESVRLLLPGRKSSVIPVEIRYSTKTIQKLEAIKPNSFVQVVLWPQPSHRSRFIIDQTRKLVKSPDVRISSVFIDEKTDFKKLLSNREYDYYIIGPGVRGHVPQDMRKNPRIVILEPKLDPASLEVARIKAGVVI
jgi:DNA-binding transcriptional regulator YhcF (GntR family)